MGLLARIDRFLSRRTQPTQPARSTFGASDERERANRAAADRYEFEVEKEKGRPRGF